MYRKITTWRTGDCSLIQQVKLRSQIIWKSISFYRLQGIISNKQTYLTFSTKMLLINVYKFIFKIKFQFNNLSLNSAVRARIYTSSLHLKYVLRIIQMTRWVGCLIWLLMNLFVEIFIGLREVIIVQNAFHNTDTNDKIHSNNLE